MDQQIITVEEDSNRLQEGLSNFFVPSDWAIEHEQWYLSPFFPTIKEVLHRLGMN